MISPTEKGFTVNADFTANFSSSEKFVVFECVCRLLSKGYKPQHIELEQSYWGEDWDLTFPIERLYDGKILF